MKFLIIHVDGLSFFNFQRALDSGKMPFLKSLLKNSYEVRKYQSGLPSTTPFAQAGLLYGDNFNIPSFRWYDRRKKMVIDFGLASNFQKVSSSYFKGCKPLLQNGVAIGACYSGGAVETFGVLYRDNQISKRFIKKREKLNYWIYLFDPRHTFIWISHGLYHLLKFNLTQIKLQLKRKSFAAKYAVGHLLAEILWHQISLFAARQAIRAGYPRIFVGLYAFDELGHAFGPRSRFALETLSQIDGSIKRLWKTVPQIDKEYQLIVLSDHGQTPSIPYQELYGESFGQSLARMLPNFDIIEHHGGTLLATEKRKGKILIVVSGGLAHLYFMGNGHRLSKAEINKLTPNFLKQLEKLPGIDMVLVNRESKLRINTFPSSGDVIVFSGHKNSMQINFENQMGAHGGMDKEQTTAFMLYRKGLFKKRPFNLIELHDAIGKFAT